MVNELSPSEDHFNLFLNPNNGQMTIAPGKLGVPKSIMVIIYLGQVIYVIDRPFADSNGHIQLDIAELEEESIL